MPKKTPATPVAPVAAHPIAAAIGRTLGMMAKSTGLVHAEPVTESAAKRQRAPAKKQPVKKQSAKPAVKKSAPVKKAVKKTPLKKTR